MALACPACGAADCELLQGIALPPDGSSDEIDLQAGQCRACRQPFGALYEESRRGALDHECWHHYVITRDAEEARGLAALIEACPDRDNTNCQCEVHRALEEHEGDFRAVLAARPAPPPAASTRPASGPAASTRPASEVLWLVGGVVSLWLCAWWALRGGSSRAWFCLLIAPTVTSLTLWMLALPPHVVRQRPVGAVISLLLGLGTGVFLVLRLQ